MSRSKKSIEQLNRLGSTMTAAEVRSLQRVAQALRAGKVMTADEVKALVMNEEARVIEWVDEVPKRLARKKP
jgi:hypothetical protein